MSKEYKLKFNSDGLIAAIAVDAYTGEVLMQAYMNQEAYDYTVANKRACYYSRSRSKLWVKGETSGHYQDVVSIALDCDLDCVLLRVKQTGPACHTGERSCFFNIVAEYEDIADASILYDDIAVIKERKAKPEPGSYTNYLLEKGVDKIGKKIGEEAAEVIIAAKNNSASELKSESADLIYHLLVMLENNGVGFEEVLGVLKSRKSKPRRQNY